VRARVDPKKHAAIPAQDLLPKLLLLSDQLPSSAVTMSKMTQDAKKDEFRKYLEKAGVLELLTKSLVSLYEEPEKPNDALSYLKNSVGGSPTDKETIAKLREENELLKGKVKDLEASQVALEARVAAMSAGSSVSSSTEEKAEEKAPAATEAQPSSEPAAPATAETPADASGTSAESKPAEEKPDSEASAAVEPMETEASAEAPAVAASETPNEASPAKEAQEKEGGGEAGGE